MATLKDVGEKERELADIRQRMDDDRDLYYLDEYILKDADKRKVPGIVNVTLNQPAVFAAHVQSALMAGSEQIQVTGKGLEDKFTNVVEIIIKWLYTAVDANLRTRGEPALKPFIVEQIDIRGAAATRNTFRVKDGILIPEILPVDVRQFTHEMGSDGMIWGAYTTFRTPALIHSEYPTIPLGKIPSGKLIAVTDLWDKDTNKIYLGSHRERKDRDQDFIQENPYGYPVFTYQEVPLGSMLKDQDSAVHHAESIFFMVRDLIPQLNMLASIMQTLNLSSVKGPKQYESKEGPQAEPPENADVMGKITSVDMGGGITSIQTGDLKNAGQLLHTMLSRMIQAATLPLTELGEVPFPLSAVALIELSESSNQVFLPRLGAIGLLFQQISEMIIDQIVNHTSLSTMVLGPRGHEQSYSVDALRGKYNIEYFYTVKSPETDIARYGIADVASRYIDMDTILRDIIQVPNPTEIREKKRMDTAEEMIPELQLFHQGQAFIEQGRDIEAQIVATKLEISLDELAAGQFGQAAIPGAGEEPVRNKLGQLGNDRARSNKRADELITQSAGPSVEVR